MFNRSEDALKFILGGNAYVTVVSEKTGTRYTFRVSQPKANKGGDAPHFVGLLTGPDNSADYQYIGFIPAETRESSPRLVAGRKGNPNHPAYKALSWVLRALAAAAADDMPDLLQVHHDGRCGRCGRHLTVPESVETGFGPECVTRIGG